MQTLATCQHYNMSWKYWTQALCKHYNVPSNLNLLMVVECGRILFLTLSFYVLNDYLNLYLYSFSLLFISIWTTTSILVQWNLNVASNWTIIVIKPFISKLIQR